MGGQFPESPYTETITFRYLIHAPCFLIILNDVFISFLAWALNLQFYILSYPNYGGNFFSPRILFIQKIIHGIPNGSKLASLAYKVTTVGMKWTESPQLSFLPTVHLPRCSPISLQPVLVSQKDT